MVLKKKKTQDSAPRAADAARYAHARENTTETYVKGAGRRGPRFFGAHIELIITPRGACAELIALRCAVWSFMSRSERRYICYLRGREGGGAWEPREENQPKKAKRRVRNAYINLVPASYLVLLPLLYVQKNAQRRTTQHRKTKGRARRRTALCCAALRCAALRCAVLLSYIAGLA